jgi:hypothetical protein
MRVKAILVFVGLAASLQAAGQSLGAGVKLAEPTPIATVYANPERFVGKTIRLDGVVTAVCEAMGCWMALADSAQSPQTVRFKVDHDGALVFPISARGKRASAEGVLERIDAADKEGNEAAREQLAAQPTTSDFGKKYQVKVTGAVLKQGRP